MKYSLRSLMTFSIRDLFWLVLVAACLCWGWSEARRRAAIRFELDKLIAAGQSEIRLECSEKHEFELVNAIIAHLGESNLELAHDDRGYVVRERPKRSGAIR
jgi:hypothetical protein